MTPALEAFRAREIRTEDGMRLRAAVFEPDPAVTAGGVCMLLNGQTEFIEKYGEVIDELRRRGLTVATFDWRGQGGSARSLPNPLKCHVGDFAEFDRDLAAFLDQIVHPLSGRPVALAHSMGAHVLLRLLHRRPDACARAVMVAPMQRVSTRGQPEWAVPLLARAMTALGKGGEFVWGLGARDIASEPFEGNLVTGDRPRFERVRTILRSHPNIRLSGPTWGWLAAAYASMRAMAAPGYAEAITTPLLVFGAGRDRIVHTEAVRAFAARLPHARYVEIPDSGHEILMERDAIRARFWAEFDAFMAA